MHFSARILAVAAAATLMLSPARVAPSQNPDAARSCPETPAPQPPFTPTGVAPREAATGWFFFGTPKLSVYLHHPWSVNETKIPWFSDDAHFPTPVNLKVTGRRLDGDSPPAKSHPPNIAQARDRFGRPGIDFITSSMEFPTAGCWEITARMNETELRFVTYVKP